MEVYTNTSWQKRRSFLMVIGMMLLIIGCQTTVIEVNEVEFFISKKWKIKEVIVNGDPVTDIDLTQYRLDLKEDFTFTRTTINGDKEEGNWKLTAGLSQIVLFVGDPREERYLLIDLKVREMEIKLLQDSFKQGELDIRYFLEPTKAQ